jgi:hypothetical protein
LREDADGHGGKCEVGSAEWSVVSILCLALASTRGEKEEILSLFTIQYYRTNRPLL